MFYQPFNGSDRSSLSNVQQGERQSHTSMARYQKSSKASQNNYHHYRDEEEMDAELWYACAGPQHTLPPVNSLVAYFPQGHIEQVASFNNPDVEGHFPRYDHLPAAIPCALNDIRLSADPDTDEVFATLTLCPVSDPALESYSLDSTSRPKAKSVSFAKQLTISDTSTHGGFSVPRRGAEDCFPPLDKTQDNPIQDLIAKDLHGNEWKFRHLFRGQPKRHLLTTGWSVFVSQKRLVAGDEVLFLRGEDGQLRIAVRLAPRQQKQQSIMVTTPTMAIGVLEAANHAAREKSRFSLIYNPRSCPSQFVIPYAKYANAMKITLSPGQRIKSEFAPTDAKSLTASKNSSSAGQRNRTRFESEDSSDSRLTGTITDISDYDSARWPGSVWRSIQVNWDESCNERQERVSPWEIAPFSARTSQLTQDRSRKRYKPPQQVQTAQLGPSITMMPGAQYRRPDPLPAFGSKSIQDLFGSRSVGIHEGESESLGMQVYRAYHARCGTETSLQPCSSPRPSTLHSFIKSEPCGETDLELRVSSVVEEQASHKASYNTPSIGPSLREWLPPSRPQQGSRSGIGAPDCTALSMNSLPSSDCGSSSHVPAPMGAPWGSQTQTPTPDGTHRCMLFGVTLDRPATPPESREEFGSGDASGYDSSRDAYHDTSRGAEQSTCGVTSLDTTWSRSREVDWQQKLVQDQRGFQPADRSNYH